jgi:hypothetical protein
MPCGPASNSASSIIVIIADDIDFQISEVLVIVKKCNSDIDFDDDDDDIYIISLFILMITFLIGHFK